MTDHTLIHYTPQAVAKEIDVSVQSVRRWADTYKDLLSESANPARGKTRLYVWDDIQILRQIKELRDKGLTLDAITISLSESAKSLPVGDIEPTTDLSPVLPSLSESSPSAIVAQDYVMSIERRLEALAALPAKMEALEARANEAKKIQRDRIQDLMTGAVVALLVVLIIIVVVDLWAK